MATISEALAIAIEHHQGGRLNAAEHIYRQILQVEPNQTDAIQLLGLIAHQVGKHELAVEYIKRAIGLNNINPSFHNNLGEAYRALRRVPEAVVCYRRALELEPELAEARINLGNALRDQGRMEEAVDTFRKTIDLKPEFVAAHNNLGNALKGQGKLDEAIACFRQALILNPTFAAAHNNLGVALKDCAMLDKAAASYRRAIELEPGFAEAHSNLGGVFMAQGRLDDAVDCFHRALELKPDFSEAHFNLGNAVRSQGMLNEALACYHRALKLKPEYAEAHNSLGCALTDQGRLEEALTCYRQALDLKPDYAEAHSNLLLTLQYVANVTPAALSEAHAEYDHRHAAPLRGAIEPQESAQDRPGRLRLGFVSPDLGRHPVGFFLVGVLENLNQKKHDTVCYSDRVVKDPLTHRLQAAATEWRDVMGLNDERLAEQIRTDRIDILFDLAGHTAGNRLLVFARKPAPVQVTWAGYVGTTGLTAIDYLLADRYHVPPSAEQYYQERVLRMPAGYVCYAPPDYAPPVAPLPALGCGKLTFGCFNNPAKVTPQVIEIWARILHRLPDARLVLKYRGWNDSSVVQRYSELFTGQGIDPARVEFLGHSPHTELLAEYNRMDLALDPFPYSGGLTTCEALWMGVPVITCPSETFASRHSLSHLSNVGLTETIAHDLDDYVERAVALAGDLPKLARTRARLRKRMATSPLCDAKRFATNLSRVLHDAWRQRNQACKGKGRS